MAISQDMGFRPYQENTVCISIKRLIYLISRFIIKAIYMDYTMAIGLHVRRSRKTIRQQN